MPPRRSRRKQGDIQKAPLVFTESPIHLVHRLPSPVLPCDHPAHAEVVPIELGEVWVSPQFRNHPLSPLKPRHRSRQAQRSGHRHSSLNGSDEHAHPKRKGGRKYVPLRMFGEEDSPVATAHDLDSEPEDTRKQPQAKYASTSKSKTLENVTTPLNISPQVLAPVDNLHQENTEPSSGEFTRLRPKDRGRKRGVQLTFSPCSTNSDNELHHDSNVSEPGTPVLRTICDLQNEDSFCNAAESVAASLTSDLPYPPQPTRLVSAKRQSSLQPLKRASTFSRLLETPEHSNRKSSSEISHRVLAFETPEAEYGRKLRWRQLNRQKPRRSDKSQTLRRSIQGDHLI